MNLTAWLKEIGLDFEPRADGRLLVRMPVLVDETTWLAVKDMPTEQRAALNADLAELKAPKLKDEEKLLAATITTDAVDRYRDIVEARGGNLKDYRKNPVVLWAHNRSELPVGIGLKLEKHDDKITTLIRFSTVTERAVEVAALYKEGTLRAFSIGFIPIKTERRKDADGKEMSGYVFKKWDLLEFSCVPVPANPEALVNAFTRGLLMADSELGNAMLDELTTEQLIVVNNALEPGKLITPAPTEEEKLASAAASASLEHEADDTAKPLEDPEHPPLLTTLDGTLSPGWGDDAEDETKICCRTCFGKMISKEESKPDPAPEADIPETDKPEEEQGEDNEIEIEEEPANPEDETVEIVEDKPKTDEAEMASIVIAVTADAARWKSDALAARKERDKAKVKLRFAEDLLKSILVEKAADVAVADEDNEIEIEEETVPDGTDLSEDLEVEATKDEQRTLIKELVGLAMKEEQKRLEEMIRGAQGRLPTEKI